VAAAVLAAVATLAAQQAPARDPGVVARPGGPGVAAPTGTAAVAGVVTTDDRTPRPLRRARVTLTRTEGTGNFAQNVATDDEGRFTFVGLAAGRYTLQATKGGYVRSAFGGGRIDRRATPLSLADGQRMTGVALQLTRGAVIAGTITDETGVPAVGVAVAVMQYRMQPGGTRTLEPPTDVGTVVSDQTDDRGSYRIFGLAAGDYAVVATPRLPGPGSDVRAMTDTDIRGALQSTASAARPGARSPACTPMVSFGFPGATGSDSCVPTATPTPRPDPPAGSMVTYAPVYFPGTTSSGNLSLVTVGAGEERTNTDFQLQLVRTSRISGTVIVPPGVSPQSVQLIMTPAGSDVPVAGASDPMKRTSVAADGSFSYTGIPPGQYSINARTGPGAFSMQSGSGDRMMVMVQPELRNSSGGPAPAPSEQYWGMTPVTVQGQNLSDVAVSLQPAMTVSGRIAFDRTRLTPPTDLTRVRLSLVGISTGPGLSVGGPSGAVDAGGTFKLTGVVPGRYRLEGFVPGDSSGQWTLGSVMVNNRDVLDLPLDVAPNEQIANAVVTFTDATQDVSGTLQDSTGRPAPDYTILVFAADSRYWNSSARRIRSTRPGTDGKFSILNLPAGNYRIAALTEVAPTDVNDPAFLASIADASVPFTLSKGEKRVQDFRLGR